MTLANARKHTMKILQSSPTEFYTFQRTHISFGCMDEEDNLEEYTRHCGSYC